MDRLAAIQLLESQHTFPSDHRFHVIVRAIQVDVDRVMTEMALHCGLPSLQDRVEFVPSRQGNYFSLRMTLPCQSAEAVLDVYARLQTFPEIIRYF